MDLELVRESIKSEPVTDAEVRMLLEWIGERELGGPDIPTIGAIAEATGADPLELARQLELMRKGEQDQLLTQQVGRIEAKIDRIDERLRQPAPAPIVQMVQPVVQVIRQDVPAKKVFFDSIEEHEETSSLNSTDDDEWNPMSVIVGIVVFVVFLFVVSAFSAHNRPLGPDPECYRITDSGGRHPAPCSFSNNRR